MLYGIKYKSIAMFFFVFFLLSIGFIMASGCRQTKVDKVITVSLLPHKYFVEKLVDSSWEVQALIEPGFDPHSYDPGMKTALMLAKSRLYICNGNFVFEQELIKNLKYNSPNTIVVDTSSGITLITETHEDDAFGSDEGYLDKEILEGDGEDNNTETINAKLNEKGIDPHYWMSPPEMVHQINEIKNALIKIDPDRSDLYENRFMKIKQDITNFDNEAMKKVQKSGIKSFMIYHPVLSYFARHYDLRQISFEIEGKSPSPQQIVYVVSLAKKEKIKTLFFQQGFDMSSSMAIAREINGKVVEIDPLSYNWFESMRFIVEALVSK